MTKTMDSAAFRAAHQEGLKFTIAGCYSDLRKGDHRSFEQTVMLIQKIVGQIGRKQFYTEDPEELHLIDIAMNQWFGAIETLFNSEECRAYGEAIDAVVQSNWHRFEYDDGGRKAAGHKGEVRDCVVRAIAIGTDRRYQSIWDHFDRLTDYSPDDGVYAEDGWEYLKVLGWQALDITNFTVMGFAENGLTAILETRYLGESHWTTVQNGVIRDIWGPIGLEVFKAYYPPQK